MAGHEFGHNLGFHHASSFACSSGGVRVTLSDSCVQDEYGDPFDLMGTGWQPRHTSAWNKGTAGWLTPANKVTATGANTYLIAPAGGSSPGIQSLRVPRDGTGEWFYLEFRQPFGTLFENWAPTAPAVTGVTVRLAADYGSMTRSKLLDATPGTATFNDAPLPAGATLNDPAHAITIICDGISPAGATVRVTVGDDTSPPTAPSALTASRTGTTASLSWAAASDDRGVVGYRLYRDGQQVGTPAGVSAVDSGLDRTATYAYAVRAVDAAGNLGPPSATVTAALVNAVPSAPTGLVAVVDDRPAVVLSWSPSTRRRRCRELRGHPRRQGHRHRHRDGLPGSRRQAGRRPPLRRARPGRPGRRQPRLGRRRRVGHALRHERRGRVAARRAGASVGTRRAARRRT